MKQVFHSPVSKNHRTTPPHLFSLSPPKGSPVHGEGKISLRVDQPVENCQVMVHAFFRSVDGDIDDKDVELRFNWFRSSMRRACANPECPRRGDGNVLLLVAKIECVMCCRLGITREHSCFCSADCFKLGWQKHKLLHVHLADEDKLHHFSLSNNNNPANDNTPKVERMPWKSQLHNLETFCPQLEETWIDIHHSNRTYIPLAEDVGHVLRVECTATKVDGGAVITKTVETGIVLPFPPMPPKRQMLANVNEERPTPRLRQIGVFRVLTYNILAEIYATRQMYSYCPLWALNWSFRREILQRELQSYNADILCLQEVQGDHYKKFFYPMMSEMGYEGWYLKKTRESMGLEGKVDGCALFYKKNRFIMKEQYPLEFNEAASEFLANIVNDFEMAYPNAMTIDREAFQQSIYKIKQRLLRDNVAQIAVLEAVPSNNEVSRKSQSGPLICISNVHTFSNPKFPDVKMWQTHTLVKQVGEKTCSLLDTTRYALESVFTMYQMAIEQIERVTMGRNLPIILCGDFNSEPTSSVYEYMTRNHVSNDHPDVQHLADIMASMDMEHNIPFGSAYCSVFGEEPEYTNYTGHWTGVVDYVWYTREQLTPFAGLKVHPPEVLESYSKTALPNCQYMSDHVPLCLDFCFKASYSSSSSSTRY